MALVWDSTVPAPERFTLLALADRADEDGQCWPSIPTLAKKCRTGESTIRRHLKALKKLGVITIDQRWNASSVYTISLPKLRELVDEDPSQDDTPCQIDTPSQSGTPSQIDTPSVPAGQIARPINLTPPARLTPPPKVSGPPSQSERLSIIDPSVSTSSGAHKASVPRKRGTRIPENFPVTPEMVAWARAQCPNVDGRHETAKFVDYWTAASGRNAVKLDWVATWRNWMRKAEEDAGRRRPGHLRSVPATPLPDDPGAAFDELRERGAGREASRLLGIPYMPPPQPPSDKTPPPQWARDRAIEWIDAHEAELRAALTGRKTG